jgi:methylmalonyl-CoA/ethylmalonyl-CoA epimerase
MATKSGKKPQVPGSYPFKVTHIGVVTTDMDRTIKRYEAMGVGPFQRFHLPDERFTFKRRWNYDIDVSDHVYEVAYGQFSGGFGVEIFRLINVPNPEKNIAQQFLDSKGEGVWHLGHDVENMEEAIEWMKNAGYEVIGGSEYVDGTLMCYFGTQDLGYIIQFHQVVKGSVADQLTNPVEKK